MKFYPSYQTLPPYLYSAGKAAAFPRPKLIAFNRELSSKLGLGLEDKSDAELARIFSGSETLPGSTPISLAYAGHQFGHFVPQLGDGRALLLGEVLDPEGKRCDLQLKGSGQTIYSRNGDGRSSLGPVLREYILSEAMHKLGVPTTRALAAVATGEEVLREIPLPGAIFTRVASSHLRIGTFQFLAGRKDVPGLKTLLSYAIHRHFPELEGEKNEALLFLRSVAAVQVRLVAQWMSLGFIHGVMNTDNMSISGETIDYGPCAFMDHFDFGRVYSFIDRQGRYAYGNQPRILLWNLSRLADCLIPLIDAPEAEAIELFNQELGHLPKAFEEEFHKRMARKLGLEHQVGDEEITKLWLEYLQEEGLDFTLSYRKLAGILDGGVDTFFPQTKAFRSFEALWRRRVNPGPDLKAKMDTINPLYIPRNHFVERVIQEAIAGRFEPFFELNKVLATPFDEEGKHLSYTLPPEAKEVVKNTFCGT